MAKEEGLHKSRFWKFFFLAIALIVIVILGVGLYFYWPYLQSDEEAILNIEKGSVEINSGKGFVEAKNRTDIEEGWTVKTNEDSEAEIIFFGSASLRLSQMSSLLIQEIDEENRIVKIKQEEGDIWYDILEGSGITIELETADGNFTNEGTSFGCSLTIPPQTTSSELAKKVTTVIVSRGSVAKLGESKIVMPKGTQTTITPISVISKQAETNAWIENNEKKSQNFVVQRREDLKKKYSRNIKLGKTAYSKATGKTLGDSELNTFIDRALTGELDVAQMLKDGTISTKSRALIPKELIYVRPIKPERTIETKSGGQKKPEIFIPVPKDVVVDLSECHEGQIKSEIVEASREIKEARGIEWVKIKDWKGWRGLPASEQKKIIENTDTGLKVIDYIGKAGDLFDLGLGYITGELAQTILQKIPPFGYDQGFADPAKDAMMDKLKEWQEKGALAGMPEWIEVEFGPVWRQYITKISYERKVYECVNKKWKYAYKDKILMTPVEYKKSPCFEITYSAGTYRYSPNIENIPLEQCTAGRCLNAWAGEFPKALSAAMGQFKAGAVGKCVP